MVIPRRCLALFRPPTDEARWKDSGHWRLPGNGDRAKRKMRSVAVRGWCSLRIFLRVRQIVGTPRSVVVPGSLVPFGSSR
jgi:hypothetical protein